MVSGTPVPVLFFPRLHLLYFVHRCWSLEQQLPEPRCTRIFKTSSFCHCFNVHKDSLYIKLYVRVQQVSWKFDQFDIDLVDLMSRGCQSTVAGRPRTVCKMRFTIYENQEPFVHHTLFADPFCCSNLKLIK